MGSFNFGPAARDESIVHGAHRPGYYADSPGKEAVTGWIDFMVSRDIGGVCTLLTTSELNKYSGLIDTYQETFGEEWVCHEPIQDHGGIDEATFLESLVPFFQRADRENTPIVVHCSAGQGRTGHVMVLWLAHARGYSLEEAIEEVQSMGRYPLEDVSRQNLERILD